MVSLGQAPPEHAQFGGRRPTPARAASMLDHLADPEPEPPHGLLGFGAEPTTLPEREKLPRQTASADTNPALRDKRREPRSDLPTLRDGAVVLERPEVDVHHSPSQTNGLRHQASGAVEPGQPLGA